jgi:acyl carrier protein
MSDVFNQVKSLIAEQLEVDEEQITMESLIVDDLGADSLDVVELIMHLEDKFSIEIPEAESEKIVSVGDVVRFIEANT